MCGLLGVTLHRFYNSHIENFGFWSYYLQRVVKKPKWDHRVVPKGHWQDYKLSREEQEIITVAKLMLKFLENAWVKEWGPTRPPSSRLIALTPTSERNVISVSGLHGECQLRSSSRLVSKRLQPESLVSSPFLLPWPHDFSFVLPLNLVPSVTILHNIGHHNPTGSTCT